MNKLLYFTIGSVFFPIYIRFSGKDALTTASVFIMLTFFIFIVSSFLLRRLRVKFIFLVVFLSTIGLFSTFAAPAELFDKSVRNFAAFFCSLLLFFTIVNQLLSLEDQERRRTIDALITLIVILLGIQILIGVILYFYPPFGKLFSVFTTRDKDILQTQIEDYKRLTSIIAGGEGFGEIITVMAPLLFYIMLKRERVLLPVVLCLFYTAGVFLSATRSSIILFALAALAFLIINYKYIKISKVFIVSYMLFIILVVVMYGFPTLVEKLSVAWEIVLKRFNLFFEIYIKTQSIDTAVNRKVVWDYSSLAVLNNLNALGNGLVTPGNFHNLYLTLIYQFGVFGFSIFLGFFIYLLVKMIFAFWHANDSTQKALISCCIIAFAILLINEFKLEFTRHSSYQQIIWALFAVFLATSITRQKKEIKA